MENYRRNYELNEAVQDIRDIATTIRIKDIIGTMITRFS